MNRYEPKMRELNAEPLEYDGASANGTFPLHITEAQIQEAELQMGARFPDDYREFIRDFGGFSLYDVCFPIKFDVLDEGGISVFYAIVSTQKHEHWDIVRNYLSHRDKPDIWRPEWLHIGWTGGTHIAMSFKGSDIGRVYFIEFFEPRLVAYSFDEFMNLLYKGSREFSDIDEPTSPTELSPFWDTFTTESSGHNTR